MMDFVLPSIRGNHLLFALSEHLSRPANASRVLNEKFVNDYRIYQFKTGATSPAYSLASLKIRYTTVLQTRPAADYNSQPLYQQ